MTVVNMLVFNTVPPEQLKKFIKKKKINTKC